MPHRFASIVSDGSVCDCLRLPAAIDRRDCSRLSGFRSPHPIAVGGTSELDSA